MCGIFGAVSLGSESLEVRVLQSLSKSSRRRGVDGSGTCVYSDCGIEVTKSSLPIDQLVANIANIKHAKCFLGHSRLVTNGNSENQPVVYDGTIAIHNGIICNIDELWAASGLERRQVIDTEFIPAFFENQHLSSNQSLVFGMKKLFELVEGVVNTAVILSDSNKFILASNNGSLYTTTVDNVLYFSSEKAFLECAFGDLKPLILQVHEPVVIDLPPTGQDSKNICIKDFSISKTFVRPILSVNANEASLLEYKKPKLKRCTKCILPHTMPFIKFDSHGVCNYCGNYKPRNIPRPIDELLEKIDRYKIGNIVPCIVPFSGGRDSTFTLHYLSTVLNLKTIAYTYDWGMVTDLGRRNISRTCSKLGVENIIVAADIVKKRRNISKNLSAWLNKPDLGMLNILTAGDKHFFRYINDICKETNVPLNIWGINPLEITHFKSGFLGMPPNFSSSKVFNSGLSKQVYYQYLRLQKYLSNPLYFNSSLLDSLSGEYFRSIHKNNDFIQFFDYYQWSLDEIDATLLGEYNWEVACDTSTTWRIGDATAAFYNYANYTLSGFTEHDTFRSNQIREGQITREQALLSVEDENQPRYQNIKWYLDTLGFDFASTIKAVNNGKRYYES